MLKDTALNLAGRDIIRVEVERCVLAGGSQAVQLDVVQPLWKLVLPPSADGRRTRIQKDQRIGYAAVLPQLMNVRMFLSYCPRDVSLRL